jgi:hypothetical protein
MLLCLGLGLGAWSCGPTHCGYNGGDSACAARDPNTPYCDLCLQDNDGCVAFKPSDEACVLVSDSGAPPPVSTLDPSNVASTNEPDPTTSPGPTSLPPETTEPPPQTTTNTTQTTLTTTSTTDFTTDVSTSSSESTSTTTSDETTSGSTSSSTSTTSDETTSGESTSTTADDTTGPPPPMCGNDVVEALEMCDGSDLAGKKCTDFAGKGGGTLVCTPACDGFDTAGCCLANSQPCSTNGECCNNSCKFDLGMLKNICK